MLTFGLELNQMSRLFYFAIGADIGLVMTHSVGKALQDSEGARHSFFEVPCCGRERAFRCLVLQDFAKRIFSPANTGILSSAYSSGE
jgi:hypothetical protein